MVRYTPRLTGYVQIPAGSYKRVWLVYVTRVTNVPEEFIIQKFYQHAGYPKYTKSTNTYTGGCPVCREGKSWGRKSRCYYIPNDRKVCCHNCGWYSSPVDWILEVEKITFQELIKQIDSCDYEYGAHVERRDENKYITNYTLPKDSINLFDRSQLNYYKNETMVRRAAEYVVRRGLNLAANRPKSLYISLDDPVHKNRLIIPFFDNQNKCTFYQSRQLIDDGRPKYLSKSNSDKTLFNYNNVCSSAENVFITEGPIDSFFINNSVAVAGIQERSNQSLTTMQKQQLDRLFLMQTVWVLDSQWSDQASKTKSLSLLKSGECVFIWPQDLGTKFKDVNDVCIHFKINSLSEQYILKHTYCGLKGLVKLKQIK